MTERKYRWSQGALLPILEPEAASGTVSNAPKLAPGSSPAVSGVAEQNQVELNQETGLLAADSFLVTEGRVKAIELHRDRFIRSVSGMGVPEAEIANFWSAAIAVIPRKGSWFPRLELSGTGAGLPTLSIRLRESPSLQNTAKLWTLDQVDPRRKAQIKGPDLALGAQLRRRAELAGADEAVLLNSDGYICEGALSALVWWQNDALFAPNDEVAWLPSVTRALVLELAQAAGYRVHLVKAKPADLVDCEVWLLSALHGIRVATEWIGLGAPLAKPRFAEAFTLRLKMLEKSLD